MSLQPRSRLQRRRRLRARSAKKEARRRQARPVVDRMYERDGHRCLLEDRRDVAGPCAGRLTPHHLLKEGQGGTLMLDNLVTLCAHHNVWVEDHPPAAHMLGLVVRRGETLRDAWQRMRHAGLVPWEHGP